MGNMSCFIKNTFIISWPAPMKILAKYSPFPNYTLADQRKIMPLELFITMN